MPFQKKGLSKLPIGAQANMPERWSFLHFKFFKLSNFHANSFSYSLAILVKFKSIRRYHKKIALFEVVPVISHLPYNLKKFHFLLIALSKV